MHALHTRLFIRMCAHVYIDANMCPYTYVHAYMHMCALALALALSLSLSPSLSFSVSLCLSLSLSLPLPPSLPPSLSLTFKLPEQFYDLTFLPGGFVSFRFGSTSKSYAFIDLAVVMESGAYLVDPY